MEEPYNLRLRVSWISQLVQIVFAIIWTIASVYALISTAQGVQFHWTVFIIFGCLAYIGWANAFSTVQITEKLILVNVFYGRFGIKWNEVEKIAIKTPYIALIGKDKRLVLSLAFAGKNKDKMIEYIDYQTEQRNIKIETADAVFPLTHKNARVWW
jgi:hypothetical protein